MTDLDVYQPAAVDGYQARMVMTAADAKAQDDELRRCMKAVLREGTDYGAISGTDGKPTLWRPGAQKMLQWFGLGFTCDRIGVERDEQGRKHGIDYRCVVTKRLPDGTVDIKATCEGTADYDESKFHQDVETVRARLRDQEHKWAARDRRVPNADRWNNAKEYRADWNALMKRAQKRAIVGAVVDATAAGGIFSADDEDDAPAVHDDSPGWYEQALEHAVEFTDVDEGRALYVEAAQAHRDGRITRRQQDRIQNIVRKRGEQLKTVEVVEVEDLARQAAAGEPEPDPTSRQDATSETHVTNGDAQPATPTSSSDADGSPEDRHRELVGVVLERLQKLGVTEHGEQVWAAGKLARSTTESLHDLDDGELADVAHQLGKIRSRKRLEELLAAADEGGTDG